MNVGERGGMAEHFDVHCTDEVLLEIFGCDIFLCHVGFEGLELIDNDFIFLLFGLSLANALNELLKLLGEMAGCRGHYVSLIRNEYFDEICLLILI